MKNSSVKLKHSVDLPFLNLKNTFTISCNSSIIEPSQSVWEMALISKMLELYVITDLPIAFVCFIMFAKFENIVPVRG